MTSLSDSETILTLRSELRALLAAHVEAIDCLISHSVASVAIQRVSHPDQVWANGGFLSAVGLKGGAGNTSLLDWRAVIHPEDTARLAAAGDVSPLADMGLRVKASDQSWVTVPCRTGVFPNAAGEAFRLIFPTTDPAVIGDRSLSREPVRNGPTGLLQKVLGAARAGIIAIDKDRRILVANAAARHMLGGLLGDDITWPEEIAFLDPGTLEQVGEDADPIRSGLMGHALQGHLFAMSRKRSTDHRYIRFSSEPVDDEETNIRLVIALDDTTIEHRAKLQAERVSRLDALGQLSGGIAHDFNNILGVILPSLELALRSSEDQKIDHLLGTALNATKRGAELSQRLLSFARRQPGRAEGFPVQLALQEMIALTRRTLEESIQLELSPIDEDMAVHCDRGQFDTVVLNLVLNARDALIRSGKGAQILLSARRLSNERRGKPLVEISVTDNGPGMPEHIRERAADPFFTTKSDSSGTGLGLSMAYGFAKQSDGELRIYSEDGMGTSIRLILPSGETSEAHDQADPAWIDGMGRTILVAEDEADLRASLAEVLVALGYVPTLVGTGDDAFGMIERGRRFDILLTDIVMPGLLNGFELAERVRAIAPETAVVYMSGYTGFAEDGRMIITGEVLQKPCDIGIVSAALARVSAVPKTPDTAEGANITAR